MAAQSIGLIGLGLLGSALAERLARGGFRVVGFDIDPNRLAPLGALGGVSAHSAAEVARGADRLLLSLPTADVVEALLMQLATELRPGQTIVDTTTGPPAKSEQFGARLQAIGVNYLDATIAGSSEQVRAGDVIAMVGGEASVHAECADLLATFTRACYFLGPWGSGARMKLVVNLVLGLNRAVLAEGLTLARALGFDQTETLRILQDSAAYSKVMDIKGRKMIEHDFQPQARLSQHLKDVRLILAEAQRLESKTPLSLLHEALLSSLEQSGNGNLDNSAIIKAFE
jgi:3-hydroxyisobutyrate dehydrogenase-like beta-hydroxyacid dehydrogenase